MNFFPSVWRNLFITEISAPPRWNRTIFLAEDQWYIRDRLKELSLAAFVADGSVLPRESGISSLPMKDSVAVPVAGISQNHSGSSP